MKNQKQTAFYPIIGGCTLVILIFLVIIGLQQGARDGAQRLSSGSIPWAPSTATDDYSYGEAAQDGMDRESVGGSKAVFAPSPMPPTAGDTAAETTPRIIKTASLAVDVDGVEIKTAEVIAVADTRGGFVQSSTIAEDREGYKVGVVTVRVPSDKFEETITAIKNLSVRVDTESVQGQDVTEQYSDLEARLASAQAQEQQFLTILTQAKTVDEILSVQSYLGNIRYEIESLQGQIKSLSNQTTYSTISVTLREDIRIQAPAEKFDLGRDFKTAVQAVILLAQAALTLTVRFLVIGAAVFIPLALILWVIVKVVKKIMNMQA